MGELMTEDTLNDTERETLAEAFHAWDHAHEYPEHCAQCGDFLGDMGALVGDILAARTAALARDRDALAAKAWDQGFIAARGHLSDYRPNPYRAALAGPEDTARDTQRDNEGSGHRHRFTAEPSQMHCWGCGESRPYPVPADHGTDRADEEGDA